VHVGEAGVDKVLEVKLDKDEKAAFKISVEHVRELINVFSCREKLKWEAVSDGRSCGHSSKIAAGGRLHI